MALVSPGIEVTIIDQSQYLPTASSSVPLLLVATAQNKINASGTGVAAATTAANANKLYQVTSQRDLVNLYGNPFFYKTTNGTPIQGYELNEYGLQAAYSLMGATNRAYVLRADIDLAELVGTLSRPTGEPDNGTYWLDTSKSTWGIYEFNATTGKFTNKVPLVLTDAADISNGKPSTHIGNIGDYAVIPASGNRGTYFSKSRFNEWNVLGSKAWQDGLYTVLGTPGTFDVPENSTFTIQLFNGGSIDVTFPSGSQTAKVDNIAMQINDANIYGLTAYNINDNLAISFSGSVPYIYNLEPGSLTLVDGVNSPLTLMGILSTDDQGTKTFYQPETIFGTSAQMPLWTASQEFPHPTGSVWVKTSTAGLGIDIGLSQYNSTLASWNSVNVSTYISGAAAIADIDSEGGKHITEGTVFAQYSNQNLTSDTPLVLWERLTTGATVITGGTPDATITGGLAIQVKVSVAGSSSFATYAFQTTGGNLTTFVSDWQSQNIADTDISINTDGQLQITQLNGGIIQLGDFDVYGQSNGLLIALGLTPNDADNINYGPATVVINNGPNQSSTSGSGEGFVMGVMNYGGRYVLLNIISGGTGYQVGDTITVSGDQLGGSTPANDLTIRVCGVSSTVVTSVNIDTTSSTGHVSYLTELSNWVPLTYISNEGTPAKLPANGRHWYYSTATQVDIMVQKGGQWIGYKHTAFDSSGFPSVSGSVGQTDPLGPIMNTDAPTLQTDGSPLVYGDLWIDTNDLENYPMIYRWENVAGVDQWVLIDVTDQTTHNGILFADARWGTNGGINPVDDPIPTIVSLLSSDYIDLDCPDPAMYPQGMLLWNTRRSGYNVKKFVTNYFTGANFATAGNYDAGDKTNISNLPEVSYTWVSTSGLKTNGSAYMGRKAQRNLVVQAMKAAIGTNQTIREEDNFFNLIAAPGYPELQPDMVVLNNDRNNTAYIVGDTPLRLADNATDIAAWATNKAGATASGEDGWVTRDSYLGVFYPSGITTDYTGAQVVVPASHMMLRTFLRNDTVAYPWFAAAGTRRGTIDNATNIGYINGDTGEFVTIKNRMSIRDVLYTNQINPLAYFTGVGLLNYGNKNSFDSTSALDRTNVARLVAYIRDRLQVAARTFVFEPNDALTRSQLAGVVQSLFIDLVAKRGIYDYLVVCDETNNTPARIDRNELWVDIAIEPVKAAEFIYIPVRIMNTGEIAATGGA